MSSPEKVGKYSRVPDEEASNSFDGSTEDGKPSSFTSAGESWLHPRISNHITILIHGFMLLLYIGSTLYLLRRKSAPFVDSILDAPVVWETRTFSTHIDPQSGTITDSFSPSSPLLDAPWEDFNDIDFIRITDAEASRLPSQGSLSEMYANKRDGGYWGGLEIFHQLHCLDHVRKHFYNHTLNAHNEPPALFRAHNDHCFRYLWQVLICHVDLGVTSQQYNEGAEAITDVHSTKQCRNLDAVYQWAKTRSLPDPPGIPSI